MKILVACEFSGIVRDAFAAKGHDAWSCDILPTEAPGQHIQGDVLGILGDGWDMMIAHPPCTYLANSGARWLFEKPGRWAQLDDACAFFNALLNSGIPRIAVENPRPHKWATARVGKHSAVIHPWEHGEKQKKATCLWLRNLPPILPSENVGPPPKGEAAKEWEAIWREPPGPLQAHNRSRTFPGIAAAFAEQWG